MGRPVSWIDRLNPIVRTVARSARSHYTRHDLEQLFELQPRSAQILMASLPTVAVGRAHLIEREVLAQFLAQLEGSDNPAEVFAMLKKGKGTVVRRKLRTLKFSDVVADLDSLPKTMSLTPGRVVVDFEKVEQLAEAMMHLAIVLDQQPEVFSARYEPSPQLSPEETAAREEEAADIDYFKTWSVGLCDSHTVGVEDLTSPMLPQSGTRGKK